MATKRTWTACGSPRDTAGARPAGCARGAIPPYRRAARARVPEAAPGRCPCPHRRGGRCSRFRAHPPPMPAATPHSGKRGQQRRMDVEDAVGKRIHQRPLHQAHESGQTHAFDARIQQPPRGVPLRILRKLRAEPAAVDPSGFDPVPARALENERILVVRKHQRDARVERARRDRIENRLHVRTAAGAEDAENHGPSWPIDHRFAKRQIDPEDGFSPPASCAGHRGPGIRQGRPLPIP